MSVGPRLNNTRDQVIGNTDEDEDDEYDEYDEYEDEDEEDYDDDGGSEDELLKIGNQEEQTYDRNKISSQTKKQETLQIFRKP